MAHYWTHKHTDEKHPLSLEQLQGVVACLQTLLCLLSTARKMPLKCVKGNEGMVEYTKRLSFTVKNKVTQTLVHYGHDAVEKKKKRFLF